MTANFTRIRLAAILALGVSALPISASAAPRFAGIFTDHAVLQRGEPLRFWGTADPSAAVTVNLNGQSVAATAGADGKWQAVLPAQQPGGPFTLSATDASGTTQLNDVLVGDVFLCSGQSNMEFPISLATGMWGKGYLTPNANLRFVMVPRDSQPAPRSETTSPLAWKVAGGTDTADASAVCYAMASQIQSEQKVPVGMIDSYWGGTAIESWISPSTLRTFPALAANVDAVAQYAAAPQKAQAAHAQLQEAWWDAHDTSAKAQRAWISPAFNDSAWPSLKATSGWKDSGVAELANFEGVVWLRTRVTLTAEQAAKANELTLGPVDTFDTTWVNGQWVGSGGISWVWRDYKVPAGVFKAGENVIVLRVLGGEGGSGGLTGRPDMRFVKTSDGQAIPLTADWRYKTGMAAKGLSIPTAPWDIPASLTTLYNGMIAPLAPYNIKAVAWYQGESNSGKPAEYKPLLTALFKDWRQTFQSPDLPFVVAQLANYGPVSAKPGPSQWAELRESQRLAVAADPHAGLAVTIDVGDPVDIHPTQKVVVGQRLARALSVAAYGQTHVLTSPQPVSVTRTTTGVAVKFSNAGTGLKTYSADQAIGFELCAADNSCTYASATASGDTVSLSGPAAATAVRVRYAWAESPYVNLYNSDGLPAAPFQMEIGQMEIAQ